jgi:hypothetical protein
MSRCPDSKTMKNTFISTTLLVVLFGSCNRAVDPADPLYRTWQHTTTTYPDGRIITITNAANYDIVTFRPNGTILYGANGRYAACCFPHRFKRKGNTLDFTKVTSIPIPEVDNAGQCHLVDCVGPGASWQILSTADKQLVIETHFGIATYQTYQ